MLRGSPGPRPDAAAAAAAAALAALLPRDAAARAAAAQAGAASALPALLCAPDVPTRNAAAEALRELVADCGGAREQLRDTGGLVALCSALGGRDGVGLDCALGQSIALTLLRCAHSEPLRPALGEAGRACWVLLETRGGEWTAGPPARPAARLAALLLVALLYCSPRDGNRAAGKFCNRLGLAQAVAAMLDAAAAGTNAGSFEFLGARWRAHEPIAYCRLLAENEDFSGKLSGLGTQARLGALMASGALLSAGALHTAAHLPALTTGAGGAQPPLLDWMGAAVHIAGADAAGELGRVGSAWEGAVAGAVAALGGALCCAAPLAVEGGEEEGRGAAVPAH